MVYIQRILMKNFKSFSGLVKLNLQSGFNVITGPNGSGKSNVIDAIQFVFGELGSRRMRVPDLSGVIFDGSEEGGADKAKMAQVTIYLNNSDRGLAIDKNTVSIARKIDQQGKSTYFLNGRRSSRRAILTLLEMAGINPGGYNIVLQGTATRLSDLTPSERMHALEDLVGLLEYDEKKAEAKTRLTEAERKIEIASARIDEVRKRVDELERQRNDALRHQLLSIEEKRLNALKLSENISEIELKIKEIEKQIFENEQEIAKLIEDKERLFVERDDARNQLENYNKEANEKGNTHLPLLKSDLVGKMTLKTSLENRLNEIEQQKKSRQIGIEEKKNLIDSLKKEIEDKQKELRDLITHESQLESKLLEKEHQINEINTNIKLMRETAEENQREIELLTESLISMQESLSGLEIEVNKHKVNSNIHKEKIADLEQKKSEILDRKKNLESKIKEFELLKETEVDKLEDMVNTIEEQVKRQKSIRSTVRGASNLAKEAEVTITEFTAKRDLWKKVVTEEKARSRIKEMGEAGALNGYHGSLRELIKIDLKYQRAVTSSSNGWIFAIVVDDIETAIECIQGLKKSKIGMTKFIPLNDIQHVQELPKIDGKDIEGSIGHLIRYDIKYKPIINLIWGDTVVVKNRVAALRLVTEGYRAVTLSGDVYEAKGRIMGGHYRRPPDFSKLIPSEDSINVLNNTIKTLRTRLRNKMKDLKLSADSLRKFTNFLEHSKNSTEKIDEQIKETQENMGRLDRNIGLINDNINQISIKLEQEQRLIETIEDRKETTLLEIENAKTKINEHKESIKPSDVVNQEIVIDKTNQEITVLQNNKGQIKSEISVQRNLIDNYLELKINEAQEQIDSWITECNLFDNDYAETQNNLNNISTEISEGQKILKKVTSEVESTTRVLEWHQRNIRKIDSKIDQINRRQDNQSRKSITLSVESEKLRLHFEQKLEELLRLGFENKLDLEGLDIENVNRFYKVVISEKASLGAINQLAIEQYNEIVSNYKQLSIRLNELEKEKGSILDFIQQVEKEKQEHFMKAFNEVCENFSQIFAKLTGGGDGRLELQKPENPFSAGVDLYIQFPGKPMRLASGASGGERSVAAIAYLLAIQKFLKAPFYLFDEIDAHLDDLNLSRLADVLKENSSESQFIVVTLKDVMVHNAERIYGVFSQGGRSRVLALPMKMEVSL